MGVTGWGGAGKGGGGVTGGRKMKQTNLGWLDFPVQNISQHEKSSSDNPQLDLGIYAAPNLHKSTLEVAVAVVVVAAVRR